MTFYCRCGHGQPGTCCGDVDGMGAGVGSNGMHGPADATPNVEDGMVRVGTDEVCDVLMEVGRVAKGVARDRG